MAPFGIWRNFGPAQSGARIRYFGIADFDHVSNERTEPGGGAEGARHRR